MIFLFIVPALLILLFLYAAYAYLAYNRVKPLERACMDCAAPVNVNGFDLYLRELGVDKGLPPVILVHGGPGHSSQSFKDGFDFLASDRRVIYYDQRGSGNSQVKPCSSDYTIAQLVEELETLRCDVVRADQIVLVGHSFGSALVQRYALKYPQHVQRLVIIGGIRINNGMKNRFIWKWLGPALYSTALGLPPADPGAADAWFMKSTDKGDAKRLFDPSNKRIIENNGTLSFVPWREISLSMVGYDFKFELGRLQVPTLFIYGIADAPYTGKSAADELCAILPHCSGVAFEKSGHWPFLEEPEKFQQVLTGFLKP